MQTPVRRAHMCMRVLPCLSGSFQFDASISGGWGRQSPFVHLKAPYQVEQGVSLFESIPEGFRWREELVGWVVGNKTLWLTRSPLCIAYEIRLGTRSLCERAPRRMSWASEPSSLWCQRSWTRPSPWPMTVWWTL